MNSSRYVPGRLEPVADAGGRPDDVVRDGPGILGSLWRHRRVALVVVALAALAGYLLLLLLPTQYQARATLVLRDPYTSGILGDDTGQPGDLSVYMAKQGDIVNSRLVLDRASALLGGAPSADDIKSALEAGPSADLAGLDIRATAGDPSTAAKLANALGDAYQAVSLETIRAEARRRSDSLERIRLALQTELDAARGPWAKNQPLVGASQEALAAQISDLRQRERNIGERAAAFSSGVDLFERAETPKGPSRPSPIVGAVIGAVVGLLVAGGWAWWRAARDPRVRSEREPAVILGVPLLGRIPDVGRSFTASTPAHPPLDDAGVETYHATFASLEHCLAAIGGTSVVVTGVMPGDGATSTVLRLATAATRQQRHVILVDANDRTWRLTEFARAVGGADPADGHEVLQQSAASDGASDSAHDDASDSTPTPAEDRTALQLHPSAFFRSDTFRQQLHGLTERADIVLIDTPPLLTAAETVTVAEQADAIVLVLGPTTRRDQLVAVSDRLAFTSTPLLGYVFNRAPALSRRRPWWSGRRLPAASRRMRSSASRPSRLPFARWSRS